MIETRRLKLYPLSNEQMEHLIAEQEIPELKEAFTQMLQGCLEHPKSRQWNAIWNIECKDDSKAIVGSLSFKGLNPDGMVEIGYGTNDGYEGQGYMTEAVTAMTRWAIVQEGVKSIEAETEENNLASKRVLEKSGFIPTGEVGEEGPRFIWCIEE